MSHLEHRRGWDPSSVTHLTMWIPLCWHFPTSSLATPRVTGFCKNRTAKTPLGQAWPKSGRIIQIPRYCSQLLGRPIRQYAGSWLSYFADDWGFDGFDIDNEDLKTFPSQQFIDTVKGMRKAMPDKILSLDTYLFDRDKDVIKALADDLTYINTMAYFLNFTQMTALVEQYASVIEPGKIAIGVKSDKVGPITQGTSVEETAKLSAWNPSEGSKYGMMLWNLSSDTKAVTGQPDGTWTRAIHENLP